MGSFYPESGGGPPTGAAGGDLGLTYPNPSVLRTKALQSATSDVSVNGAAAPTAGQVLTATGPGAAEWQTPSGGTATRREAAWYAWVGGVDYFAVACTPAAWSSGGGASDADGNWMQYGFVWMGDNYTQTRWNPSAKFRIKTGPGAAGALGVQVHGWMYQQNINYLENNQALMYSDGTAGAHWFLRCRDNAGGVTAVDTGIVCGLSTVYDCELTFSAGGTLATLTINGTEVTCATNLPSVSTLMGFQIGAFSQRTLVNRINLSSN